MVEITKELLKAGNPKKAVHLMRFFKTGKNQYGEGDRFLGITVPEQRRIAKQFKHLNLKNIQKLLVNPYHEFRLTALLILTLQYPKATPSKQKKIVRLYLGHTRYINNWDLVDLSAHHILGAYLHNKDKAILMRLAKSKSLWERRIAIISCFAFIRNSVFNEAFHIAYLLLSDSHDLIHKAVGWMLREIGKRDRKAEEVFLRKNYQKMPRTMLRYAIERFPEETRQKYLKGKITLSQ